MRRQPSVFRFILVWLVTAKDCSLPFPSNLDRLARCVDKGVCKPLHAVWTFCYRTPIHSCIRSMLLPCVHLRSMASAENVREQLGKLMTRLELRLISTEFTDRNYYTNIKKALTAGMFMQVWHRFFLILDMQSRRAVLYEKRSVLLVLLVLFGTL